LSRIIRTVSLDISSDEIAAKKPNFSKWVREQLKLQDEEFQNSHVTLSVYREKGICNPSASPRCNICFPHGRPDMVNIREWNLGVLTNQELQDITEKKFNSISRSKTLVITESEEFGTIFTDGRIEPLPPVSRERKYVRRFLKAVWSWI